MGLFSPLLDFMNCLPPAFIIRDAGRFHYYCDNITDIAEFCNWLMFADQLLHVAVTSSLGITRSGTAYWAATAVATHHAVHHDSVTSLTTTTTASIYSLTTMTTAT